MRLLRYVESTINKRRPGIKIFWWKPKDITKKNFGDEISPIIIDKIWNKKCVWTRIKDCELVATGSILELVNSNVGDNDISVWGTGCINGQKINLSKKLHICALRGPKTLNNIGLKINSTFGDPGLLVNEVFKPASKTNKIGYLLHYQDRNRRTLEMLNKNNVIIINPFDSPQRVAQQITKCKFLFSSSLHGLIFADSYNIPNARIIISELKGNNFKFDDYYSTTDRYATEYSLEDSLIASGNPSRLDDLISEYVPINKLDTLQENLIEAFPLK